MDILRDYGLGVEPDSCADMQDSAVIANDTCFYFMNVNEFCTIASIQTAEEYDAFERFVLHKSMNVTKSICGLSSAAQSLMREKDLKTIYWQCDACEEWFHPGCIGEHIDQEPNSYITQIDETARRREKEYKIPEIYQFTDDDNVEAEAKFFITAQTACNHQLEFHFFIFIVQTISFLVGYHKPKDTGGQFSAACEPYLYAMRQVKGLQYQKLLQILSEDKHLGGAYVEHALVREALAAIFVAFTGDTYTNANVECCSVIHQSTLRAMQAACAIGAAKKNELLNRYKHLSGEC
ncbi:hypothetical protein DPMN_089798 [Dreissena polymorpha]|uniref:Uncharacterized protein n=1 Tax=Dreissena polymorpha TaxID=45954 RepID=A0A9D4KWL1_DREPO|nr:hypothetical protein DPMN_089798 [Dreissena polymorpha]